MYAWHIRGIQLYWYNQLPFQTGHALSRKKGSRRRRTIGYRNYWNIVWQRNLAAQKWKYLSGSKRIIKRALTEQTTLISATVFLTLLPSHAPAMLINDSLPTRSGISPVWSHYPSLLIQRWYLLEGLTLGVWGSMPYLHIWRVYGLSCD